MNLQQSICSEREDQAHTAWPDQRGEHPRKATIAMDAPDASSTTEREQLRAHFSLVQVIYAHRCGRSEERECAMQPHP